MRRDRDGAAAAAEKGRRAGAEAARSGPTRSGRGSVSPYGARNVKRRHGPAGEVEGQAGAVYVAAAAVGARRGSGQE